MPMRSSSLANNPLAITRELDGRYDVVLQVRDNLDLIEQVAGVDFAAILAELESAQDFTGITVVQGETVAWDAVNKILTVPKGDKGDKGDTGNTGLTGPQGIQGPQGIKGDTGLKGDTGSQGPKGFDGAAGAQGLKGDTGDDLTITQITYNGNGTFNWLFSDGTTYVTPDLRGPKGDVGDQGVKGDQGISVHHIKGTSTTDNEGDFASFGEIDTYTVYGDAAETINLGYFRVNNGVAKEDQYGLMYKSTYDTNSNGVVDNSERLGGQLPEYYVNTANNQNIGGDKTFTGNVTVQGDLVVNGSSVTVNAQTVEVEDNLMLINKGEVGNGVTAGEAGILVDRGTAPDYKFVWEEAGQAFKIGEVGSLQKVATREDNPISEGIAIWDNVTSKFNTTLDVKVDSLQLNGGVGVEGTISWNIVEGTVDLQMPGGSTLQIGQENVRLVRNSTASLIANGTVCMFAGTIGNSGRIKVKPFTGGFNEAMYVYGVATQDIAAGADGLITIEGKVRGIDTTGAGVGETWLDEDILYAKPGDSGRLTKVMPSVTELRMPMASVIKAHTHGTLEIRFTPINENQFEPRNANIQTHIASTSNPHSVTKTQVGLGNVDNTADNVKNVLSATKWTTSRTLSLSGDATGSVSFDGSANVDVVVTVGNDTHTHAFGNITGKPTTLSGYGITDADTSAQVTTKINNAVAALVDASPTTLDTLNELAAALGDDPNFATTTSTALGNRVVKNANIVAGTGTKVTYDAKGLVTSSTTPTTLAGYSIGDAYTKTEVDNSLALKVEKVTSTDNAIVRFNGTTGAVQDSSILIDDNGNVGTGTQSFNGFGGSGFKNYIINGNFDIWQYATSQSSNGYGSDDRWFNTNVGSTKTHSQVACGDTERALFNASKFSRTVVSSVVGAGNQVGKRQTIEDITKLAGKTVTISFWAKADGNKKLGYRIFQNFGTGGSPTAEYTFTTGTLDITSTWQKKTITVSIPSVVGKTIGTDGAHTSHTSLKFFFDAGTTIASNECPAMIQQSGTFDIAQVQLEEGSVATPFEQRPYELELSLCQRYLPSLKQATFCISGQAISSTVARFAYIPIVQPRVPPTGLLITSGNGVEQILNATGGGLQTSAPTTIWYSSINGISFTGTVSSGLTTGDACLGNISNILFTGCEL